MQKVGRISPPQPVRQVSRPADPRDEQQGRQSRDDGHDASAETPDVAAAHEYRPSPRRRGGLVDDYA